MSEKTVFISYRRDDAGKGFARSLAQALTIRGYDVFLDVDSLSSGRWSEQIFTQVPARSHFLLALTPGALDRCVDEEDWVRREYELALEHGRNVVPVAAESVDLAEVRETSPASMAGVFALQVAPVRYGSFERDVEDLVQRYIPRHKAPKPPASDNQLSRILKNERLVEELRQKLAAEKEKSRVLEQALEHRNQALASAPAGPDSEILALEESHGSHGLGSESFGLEAIVRRHGRPVLFISQGRIDEPESELWVGRVAAARPALEAAIPAIGRIDVRNHPVKDWSGTGWLVAPGVVVTSRGAAVEFGRAAAGGFRFKRNPRGRRMRAVIDFRREHEYPGEDRFRVREILHIEPDEDNAPDVAFLRIDRHSEDDQDLPAPVPLSAADPEPDQVVGAVGYATWDGHSNDPGVIENIFQDVYHVKRLHPGEVVSVTDGYFTHDCSTLGGNSGSPLLDFETGEALGLHFAGSFEKENYAVKASAIRRRMGELGLG